MRWLPVQIACSLARCVPTLNALPGLLSPPNDWIILAAQCSAVLDNCLHHTLMSHTLSISLFHTCIEEGDVSRDTCRPHITPLWDTLCSLHHGSTDEAELRLCSHHLMGLHLALTCVTVYHPQAPCKRKKNLVNVVWTQPILSVVSESF